MNKQKEFILHGLDSHKDVIDIIAKELDICQKYFDLKLVLTEGLTNAFEHGNKADSKKPIYLKYIRKDSIVEFEVKDCGKSFNNVKIPNSLSSSDVLNSRGKGLFLIKAMSESVTIKNNSLFIKFML